uniref:Uncharacterized protein n=1 Tax=Glossina austeni TaxID=7395 RepID=A0A1A9VYY0_GLOAU
MQTNLQRKKSQITERQPVLQNCAESWITIAKGIQTIFFIASYSNLFKNAYQALYKFLVYRDEIPYGFSASFCILYQPNHPNNHLSANQANPDKSLNTTKMIHHCYGSRHMMRFLLNNASNELLDVVLDVSVIVALLSLSNILLSLVISVFLITEYLLYPFTPSCHQMLHSVEQQLDLVYMSSGLTMRTSLNPVIMISVDS